MFKYLNQLHTDIGRSILLSGSATNPDWADLDDDAVEPNLGVAAKPINLCSLFGIPPEAFPPPDFLNKKQLQSMLVDIELLWVSWLITWNMPHGLSPKKEYEAMLHAMLHGEVLWHPLRGGLVNICNYEPAGHCQHGPDRKCYCRAVNNKAVKHDLENWEEQARPQGIGPSSKLSHEAGPASEEEDRKRDILKRKEDNWLRAQVLENFFCMVEDVPKDSKRPRFGNDQDWLQDFAWMYEKMPGLFTDINLTDFEDPMDEPSDEDNLDTSW